ncbi:hypothetical protein [Streptomyces sp. Tue6028]|uniref:hypothetical protein n=1 Tax=Streptomyces sp. Tue6028 TaxID=2036037 RepID=UPI003D73B2FF
MAEAATAEGKVLAFMLREVLERLSSLGLTQRGIGEELGAGFSSSQLSRMACAAKIPTPEQLGKLLLLVEVKVGQRLPPSAREQFEAANLRAMQAMKSDVLGMLTAQQEARQYRRQAEEAQARGAVVERNLERVRRTLESLRMELRRSRARELQLSRPAQEPELAALREVIADLERSIAGLTDEAEQLRGQIRLYQAELADARQALDAQRARALEAEHAAAQDRDRRERLGEEVSVLTDLLHQARAELAELQREHEQDLARADVLAEAEAVVERAKRAAQQPEAVRQGAGGLEGDFEGESTPSQGPTAADQAREAGLSATPAEVAARMLALLETRDRDAADALLGAVAERRVDDVVAALDALGEAGCYREREQLTRACASRPPDAVVALLLALHHADAASEAGWLLDETARTATSNVKDLVTLLLEHRERAYARRLLDSAVPRGSIADVIALIEILEQAWPGEAEWLVRETVAQRRTSDVVTVVSRLSALVAETAVQELSTRPASTVAGALSLFAVRGEQRWGARLAEHAAGRPPQDVTELVILLGEDVSEVERDWLLDAYLHRRADEALVLLEHLTEPQHGNTAAARTLMRKVGERGNPAQVEEVAEYAQKQGLAVQDVLDGTVLGSACCPGPSRHGCRAATAAARDDRPCRTCRCRCAGALPGKRARFAGCAGHRSRIRQPSGHGAPAGRRPQATRVAARRVSLAEESGHVCRADARSAGRCPAVRCRYVGPRSASDGCHRSLTTRPPPRHLRPYRSWLGRLRPADPRIRTRAATNSRPGAVPVGIRHARLRHRSLRPAGAYGVT